jgi:AcrR family transcriptional regulator
MVAEKQAVKQDGRTQRRVSRTRRRLLDVALALLSERGADAAKIEEITERADVGKGTFYRHFAGKDELVVALAEEAADALVARLQKGGGAESREQAVERLVSAHCAFFKEETARFMLLFEMCGSSASGGAAQSARARYFTALEAEMAKLAGDGRMREAKRAAAILAGLVTGYLVLAPTMVGREEAEASIDAMRRACAAAMTAALGA